MKQKISITIDSSLLKDIDRIVDNMLIKNRSQAIEHLAGIALGENRTAVVLAGGPQNRIKIAKRFRSTVAVGKKTVIERALVTLRESGFKNIYIIARQPVLTQIFEPVREGAEFGAIVHYVEEHKSRGSADSLKLVHGRVSGEFLVVYGDIIFDKINLEELYTDHLKNNVLATIMMTTSSKPSEKGTLKVEGNKVLSFMQKPRQSDIYLVFSPIFVASPGLLECPGSSLEQDIFPKLAERRLLNGHLSSEKEHHIHSLSDTRHFSQSD